MKQGAGAAAWSTESEFGAGGVRPGADASPVPVTWAARLEPPTTGCERTTFDSECAPRLAFIDEHLAIAVKPSGQLTVPGRTADPQGCLHAQVQRRFADARVVHRLDMATSGLVIFARGAAAQRALNHAFAAREVDKRYIAVVRGHVCDDEGVIDLPLQADWPNRPRQQVSLAHGKPARTGYRVISRDSVARRSRLELRPETGRSHQLRVHLLALGHPILGDALYAPSTVSAETPRLLLHACGLAFAHPATGVRFQVTDVPPF